MAAKQKQRQHPIKCTTVTLMAYRLSQTREISNMESSPSDKQIDDIR